jgi:flagellar protein FlaI
MMKDPQLEDVSANGVKKPIFVWHRKYESLPSNVSFDDEVEYNNFLVKLAHIADKHISTAHPILDATLPSKHRLAATFMREVSSTGSTFCIRKFNPTPFSILDMVSLGTIDSLLAAYFWILIEYKMSSMVIGSTGAGKTSMLNALGSLIPRNSKVVTVEETAELNLPLENWVPFISRKTFGIGGSEVASISLYDLVKVSLRYRPDFIIVGEVRGEEAYVLFQAVATGHGGLCTMHADSIDHAVKRLTSPPMNVAEVYIPLMNVSTYISRVPLPRQGSGPKFSRRARMTWEIVDYNDYNLISEWVPTRDRFKTNLEKSFLLERIAVVKGLSKKEVLDEVLLRRRFFDYIIENGIKGYEDVTQAIASFYVLKESSGKLSLEYDLHRATSRGSLTISEKVARWFQLSEEMKVEEAPRD